jgi:hypothetical protein
VTVFIGLKQAVDQVIRSDLPVQRSLVCAPQLHSQGGSAGSNPVGATDEIPPPTRCNTGGGLLLRSGVVAQGGTERASPAAKQGVQTVDRVGRAVLEQPAVAGESEGNAVVSGPFGYLANVAPCGHQDGHEAVPQSVERKAV